MKVFQAAAIAMYRSLAMRYPRGLCRLKMLRDHSIEEDRRFWELYVAALSEGNVFQPVEDFFNLYQLVLSTRKLPGDIAELGVFRGGSAKLIASLKGEAGLHLFDTFEGMPAIRAGLDRHRPGDFAETSLEAVQRYLGDFSRVFFYKGVFPASARELAGTTTSFSLVHLDADIYDSTKAGLVFFYPRMVKGGVIISHDYRSLHCPGVKRAFDEFFSDKPELVIELWKTQCMVIRQ